MPSISTPPPALISRLGCPREPRGGGPETLDETALKLNAIELSPTVETSAELVADPNGSWGYHSRDGLKKRHESAWKTRISEPASPGGILRW